MSEHIQNGDITADCSGWSNAVVWATSLTAQEIALRKSFVKEYLVDYNATNAALRCGYASRVASEYATRYLQESYVQHLIAQNTVHKKVVENNEENIDYNKRRVVEALMREAFYKGPGSSQAARVSALSKLAAIYKLDKGIIEEDDSIPKGGVMYVPVMMSSDQWESKAIDAQEQLVKDSLSDI